MNYRKLYSAVLAAERRASAEALRLSGTTPREINAWAKVASLASDIGMLRTSVRMSSATVCPNAWELFRQDVAEQLVHCRYWWRRTIREKAPF